MHEHGKSDSPIVPEKLSNNGCDVSQSAERAEGRGLTKGNLFQQTKCRTQSRENLQSELERIRQPGIKSCGSPRFGTMSITLSASEKSISISSDRHQQA
jgi:hypothetical protein